MLAATNTGLDYWELNRRERGKIKKIKSERQFFFSKGSKPFVTDTRKLFLSRGDEAQAAHGGQTFVRFVSIFIFIINDMPEL